jgi:hypothetical protein
MRGFALHLAKKNHSGFPNAHSIFPSVTITIVIGPINYKLVISPINHVVTLDLLAATLRFRTGTTPLYRHRGHDDLAIQNGTSTSDKIIMVTVVNLPFYWETIHQIQTPNIRSLAIYSMKHLTMNIPLLLLDYTPK